LPFAAASEAASSFAVASPEAVNIRAHTTTGNHEFFTTISLYVEDFYKY
jgi:hypothetical protein